MIIFRVLGTLFFAIYSALKAGTVIYRTVRMVF